MGVTSRPSPPDRHDWPTTASSSPPGTRMFGLPNRRDVNGNIHTTTRPCACGAMMLDGNELANGSHVQPVDGSWMCVPDEPTTTTRKETP